METEPIFVPFPWRRGLRIARVALAGCAIASLLLTRPRPAWAYLAPAGLYLAFGAAALFRGDAGRPSLAALPFLADLSFFFLMSASAGPAGAWLAAAAFAFTLVSAAVEQGWQEVALGVTCGALSLVILPPRPELLAMAVLCGGPIALALALYLRLFHERLKTAAGQSVHYRALAESSRLAERERIADNFHDGPLQSFISFQMRLEILRKFLERDPAAARDELAQLQELCRNQVGELRGFLRGMRQAESDGAGLAASVRRLVESFQKDSGIPASFTGAGIADSADDPEVPFEVLQIVREALHNVQKHSKASRVAVTVSRSGARIEIAVDDDGCGFPFSGAFDLRELDLLQIGPLSIKRRVRELGGELTVESWPGRGASVRARIPL